jgi:hypothetical protein
MTIDRRDFTGLMAGLIGGLAIPRLESPPAADCDPLPKTIAALKPMTAGAVPIGDAERAQRREQARRLMREQRLDAIVLEPGTSCTYFFGDISWWLSERPLLVVLPAGATAIEVTPRAGATLGSTEVFNGGSVAETLVVARLSMPQEVAGTGVQRVRWTGADGKVRASDVGF